jgi:hypothetical protein
MAVISKKFGLTFSDQFKLLELLKKHYGTQLYTLYFTSRVAEHTELST